VKVSIELVEIAGMEVQWEVETNEKAHVLKVKFMRRTKGHDPLI